MTQIKTGTKTPRALYRIFVVLSTLFLPALLPAQTTGPQQLVFAGLRSVAHQGQFNAVQSDATGNLYLLLDQKDGIRLLKTDPTATNILAQAQLGAHGDIGLALALDPAGNVYITGTTTSGALTATAGAAFPAAADTSTNSFIGKFDQNLNEIFVTFAGSGRMAAASIAATADAVFITGSLFSATLPVTPSAILQNPAPGSFQNGFVEKFNATGTTLLYATYLTGLNGNTAPAAIAADASDNAYIAGSTTSSGYPTLAAVVPRILGATSGFLTKLTPSGNGIAFSTFIPGAGITSLALDPATQNLFLSGTVALGQFPVATVQTPLVTTPYQVLLRMPPDGSTVLASTLLAPGTQSTATPAPNGAAWVTGPLAAPLLPLTPLSDIGNTYALRVTQQNTIDQTLRLGGIPTTNPAYASAPVNITSLSVDPTGQPIFAGSASPTASSSLLATETYDLPLSNTPTPALPSTIREAALPSGTCNVSACAGSAAYLTKLNPTAAPSLTLSTDDSPNITLRNLGTTAATNLQLTATNFTLATNCPTTLAPGAECTAALTGTGPGTLTAQATNATTQTATLPATTTQPNPIALSTKELDFGIQTTTATRTLTITNLTQQPQPFTSTGPTNTPFTETSTDCTLTGPTTRILAPAATCHITFAVTPTADAFVQTNWTLGPLYVHLTAYTQTSPLNLSATEIDFGTQFPSSPHLPRYLYLSNNSASAIPHTPTHLAAPFTLTDRCPTLLEPHTVCQLELTYNSPIAPSADSTTLTLDEGTTVLITGTTLADPTGTNQTVNPNLTVTPASINFPNPVVVTTTSSTTQTVTIGNTDTQPFQLALSLTGDFTDTTNCTTTLAPASTCTVVLTFAPSQPGTRQGLLAVTAGTGTTPAYIPLSGVGTPILTANNGTLDFGNVIVGQPYVQWYKITQPFTTLTAATSGDYKAILVEDLGYGHGQPPSSAFLSTITGPCTNCWLGVQFKPSAAGPETATLTLTSSAGNPEPLTLTGTGLPLTGLILTPVSRDFGPIPIHSTSPTTLFTLTNSTAAPVTLNTPTTTGDFALSAAPTGGASCTGTLTPNASCFLQILFTPTATGQRTGTLTLPTSAGTQTAQLSGFGSPDTGLAINPTALNFTNIPGPTATQQTITLTNTGTAALQIATPTNANSAFLPTTNCATLAPAATCTITVAFTPANSYQTDTLEIPVTDPATGLTTYTVPLTSTYTTEDSGLQIIPNAANYGPSPTATLGLTRQFTINNLTAKSLTLAVALPRQFVLSGPPCAGLAPNASCNFSVAFLPLTNGDITGTLFAQATPTDNSATLNALGYVEGYGIGAATLAVTGNLIPNGSAGGGLLNFNQVASGQTATQTLTLTNPSSTPLTIRRITSEWPFLATTTCGTTLAPNQACTVTLTYTPLNQQPSGAPASPATNDTGTLVIESDALSSPNYIDLAGSAAPIYVAAPSNTAPLAAYTASPSSLTFATTQVGNASTALTVTLANTGTTTLHITNLKTTPDFSLQSGCTDLVPGASCPIYVTFTPQTPGTKISALEISSDASTALDFISLLGNDATPATLTFSSTALDFGNIVLGNTATLPLQITNNGSTPATFNAITTTGDYAATGTCPAPNNTLAPAQSCTVQIAFTPTQPGPRTGTLSISTSATTLPLTAALTGIGTQSHLQITPGTLNFSSLAVGASANQTLTLANTGTAPINNLTLTITGDYALTVPCALTTLAPGASCSATVTFAPTALGPRNGTLTVNGTDTNSPATLQLTGTGVPKGTFTLTVDGGPTSSATVTPGIRATYTLTVTPQNAFSGTVVLNCTPITPGLYATCSLLPSSITLSGTAQTATATINTITRVNLNKPTQTASTTKGTRDRNDTTLLCLLPAALFFFWKTRTSRHRKPFLLWAALFSATTLTLSGCGSGGDASLRYTPPGVYQYQVTATSTNGVQLTQTVTLNLTVTR